MKLFVESVAKKNPNRISNKNITNFHITYMEDSVNLAVLLMGMSGKLYIKKTAIATL